VVVELSEGKFGRSQRRTDKLAFTAFVFGRNQQISQRIVDDFELTLVLKDVFKDQFLLRSVLEISEYFAVGLADIYGLRKAVIRYF
jgi:hypothetical protein